MARTTRATRQQLEGDGQKTSPLIALEKEPRRRRAAPKNNDEAESTKTPKKKNEAEPAQTPKKIKEAESAKTPKKNNKAESTTASKKNDDVETTKTSKKKDEATPAEATKPHTRQVKQAKKSASGNAATISTTAEPSPFAMYPLPITPSPLHKPLYSLIEGTPCPIKPDSPLTPYDTSMVDAPELTDVDVSGDFPLNHGACDVAPIQGGSMHVDTNPFGEVATLSSQAETDQPGLAAFFPTASNTECAQRTADWIEDTSAANTTTSPGGGFAAEEPKVVYRVPSRKRRARGNGLFTIYEDSDDGSDDTGGLDVLDYSSSLSLKRVMPGPRKFSRLREMDRTGMINVRVWMDLDAFTPAHERELQGTWKIRKEPFMKFLQSLPNMDKEQLLTKDKDSADRISVVGESSVPVNGRLENPVRGHRNVPSPKRKLESSSHANDAEPYSKRRRADPESTILTIEPLAKSVNGGQKREALKAKPKRYAKEGGYDKKGNLVFPGQEISDFSESDGENTEVQEAFRISAASFQSQPENNENEPPALTAPDDTDQTKQTLYATPARAQAQGQAPTARSALAIKTGARITPVAPPATERAPARGWFSNRVTNSIGRLMPFTLFHRPTGRSVQTSSATPAEPSVDEVGPMAPSVPAQGAASQHYAPQAEVSQLLLSVLQQKCPEIATSEMASTFQASFASSETSLKHRAETAQAQISQADEQTQKLLALLRQQYPDLGATEILSKFEVMIRQHSMLAKFKKEVAIKQRQASVSDDDEQETKKRRRRNSYDPIPNPKGKSYGMDLDFFADDSDESGDEKATRPATGAEFERASKKPRLDVPQSAPRVMMKRDRVQRSGAGSVPNPSWRNSVHVKPTPNSSLSLFGDTSKATQASSLGASAGNPTGTSSADIFKPSKNIFGAGDGAVDREPQPQESRSTGHFAVPMSSSDSEDDDDPEPAATPSKQGSSTPSTNASASILKGSSLNAASKLSKKNGSAASEPSKKAHEGEGAPSTTPSAPAPPPAPIPSHAALPSATMPAVPAAHDPVALARAQANKYAPKTSSKLKSVSRLSNSPAASNAELHTGPETALTPYFNNSIIPFSIWDYEMDPAVAALVEGWEKKNLVAQQVPMAANLDDANKPSTMTAVLFSDAFDEIELDPMVDAYVRGVLP